MKIWHISDTHGRHGLLSIPEDIDVIVFSGDCSNWKDSARNTNEVLDFLVWFSSLDIKHKLFCGGNHDTSLERGHVKKESLVDLGITYLENSGVEIDGVKFWGSPYTPSFGDGWAWNMSRHKIHQVWDLIPDDTDVLITHGPPMGILDLHIGDRIEQCGCKSLLNRVLQVKPRYHCFGHIHNIENSLNSGLKVIAGYDTIFSNGAVVGIPKGEVVSNGNLLTI